MTNDQVRIIVVISLLFVLMPDGISAHSRRKSFGGGSRRTTRHRVQIDSSVSTEGSERHSSMSGMGMPPMMPPLAEPSNMLAAMSEPGQGLGMGPGIMNMAMGPVQGLAMGPVQGSGFGGMMNPMMGQGRMGHQRGVPTRSCEFCPADARCVQRITGPECVPYTSLPSVPSGGMYVCTMYKDPGYCSPARYIRYFYNAEHRHCERFNWSGCGGNKNRFASLRLCEYHCMKSSRHMRHGHVG